MKTFNKTKHALAVLALLSCGVVTDATANTCKVAIDKVTKLEKNIEFFTKVKGADSTIVIDKKETLVLRTQQMEAACGPAQVEYDLGFTTTTSKADACSILSNGVARTMHKHRAFVQRADDLRLVGYTQSEINNMLPISAVVYNINEQQEKQAKQKEFGCK